MRLAALQTASASKQHRWIVYTLISLIIVVGIVAAALVHPRKIGDHYDPWIQFGILTITIFGYILKWFWRYKSSAKFWLLYGALLSAHCAILLPSFSHGGRWPVLTVGLVGAVEGMAIFGLIATLRERF